MSSVKLHLGCGWRNFGDDWIHVDGGNYKHLKHSSITDLSWAQDKSVDLIYASHVFEYFDREEAINVLAEWYRILKPGAILRIAVPDFEVLCNLYSKKEITLEQMVGPIFGKMAMAETTIYHKTTYDLSSLSKLVKENGFKNCVKYDWRETEHAEFDDHSQAYIPHMDKLNGTLISLNIECNK